MAIPAIEPSPPMLAVPAVGMSYPTLAIPAIEPSHLMLAVPAVGIAYPTLAIPANEPSHPMLAVPAIRPLGCNKTDIPISRALALKPGTTSGKILSFSLPQ